MNLFIGDTFMLNSGDGKLVHIKIVNISLAVYVDKPHVMLEIEQTTLDDEKKTRTMTINFTVLAGWVKKHGIVGHKNFMLEVQQ